MLRVTCLAQACSRFAKTDQSAISIAFHAAIMTFRMSIAFQTILWPYAYHLEKSVGDGGEVEVIPLFRLVNPFAIAGQTRFYLDL